MENKEVQEVSELLSTNLSSMPLEIREYLTELLKENMGELCSPADVHEAIADHIQASVDGISDSIVDEICKKIFAILHKDGVEPALLRRNDLFAGGEAKKLDQTVDMSLQSETFKLMDNLWKVTANDVPLQVDRKKLARADERNREKAAQKATGGAGETQNNKPNKQKKQRPQIQATASQTTARRDPRMEANCKDFKLENVDISFGTSKLLCGAEINIAFGHRYGLVGRNGLGKTTLLKMIWSGQLIIPSNITLLSVEQEVHGDDTPVIEAVLASDQRRERLIGEERSIQERLAVLESSSDAEAEAEKTTLAGRLAELCAEMSAAQLDKLPARASTILFGLGFKPDEQRRPTKEFSGGWRMRVALARALFMAPDLLLLDEPTNMLDMRAVYWLESYLQEWPGTIITVSHDRRFLNAVCTDVIHLHSKRLDAYKGNYENFEKTMREKLTLQQREFEAQHQLRQHVQEFIDKFRYNAKRASMVQSRIKMLERMPVLQPVERESDVVFHFRECQRLANPVLQLDEASFRYSKEQPMIFQKICIGSDADSRICIVGENGSGKTTLLRILLGELAVTSGTRNANRRLNIGYFTQHHVDQLDMESTPLELLAERFSGANQEELRASLGRFGLSGDIVFQAVDTLSGGQKSRLAFASLSLQQPNYLILDEPTNHLDVETVDALGKALNAFQGGVVLVTHDERLIELVCKELWVVKDKTVSRLDGGLDEYRKHVARQLGIT